MTMSVLITVEIPGMSLENYDAVMKETGLSKKNAKWPKGIESHLASKSADGLLVVDTWKSEGDFKKFSEKTLGPTLGKLGISAQPKITILPIHYCWAK
jgi:hypothetical protein